ncbi:hypothetical protein BDV93DRAFT_513138 [Ceratobasidium sp. AG-I]|nr:hypothetical protein BDV93DRAFT_513138 [Ceratobasidium sp. AG-I]
MFPPIEVPTPMAHHAQTVRAVEESKGENTEESAMRWNTNSGSSAYAIERGLHRQVKRKELWRIHECRAWIEYWFLLQISHIIPYGPDDMIEFKYNSDDLLSAVTYSNCTNRRHGLAHDDAISTGGQLVRIAYATTFHPYQTQWLVWSSQCFAEGEYEAVSRTRPFGPKSGRSLRTLYAQLGLGIEKLKSLIAKTKRVKYERSLIREGVKVIKVAIEHQPSQFHFQKVENREPGVN